MYKNLKLLSIIILSSFSLGAYAQGGITSFNYTGSVQYYTVPVGISQLYVSAMGGSGGLNSDEAFIPDSPGHGACVVDTLTVVAGQVLEIFVGGKGANGTATGTISGGINGGGSNGGNGSNNGSYGGGGGGAASDIRFSPYALANRAIIAAGGGGAGLQCSSTAFPNEERGGNGGGITGENGVVTNCDGHTLVASGGGTPLSGGSGTTCVGCIPASPGSAGTLGLGGAGGSLSAGGGGGAGLFGGGGGEWSGGGGGSDSGSAHAIHTRGCNVGNGAVVITPICSAPGIVGVSAICYGLSTTFSDDTTGGTWSSSDGGTIVTINSSTGFVTGVGVGSTTITYTVGPCTLTKTFAVDSLPTPTTGADSVCVASTTTLASYDGPGTWASSNTSVGNVGSLTGVVTGVSYGTTIITYTLLATGCINTTTVVVDSLPDAITGMDTVCAGLTTTYSDLTATGLGMWSSSNPGVGSIDPVTGIITGISAGTSLITYTVPTGACFVTDQVTVHPLPSAIVGADSVCVGSETILSDAGGGTWISGSTSIGTMVYGTGGVVGVYGVLAGSTIVTYTLPTTCQITDTIQVNPLPSVIFGPDSVCVGSMITLTNDSLGGLWTSTVTSSAIIGSTSGIVTGEGAGNPVIIYTLPTSCQAFVTLTVNPLPAAITGTDSVCSGLTTTLYDLPLSGTWSSSDNTTAEIGSSSGVVSGVTTGIVQGTATMTYTLNTGCIMTTTLLVNPRALITGTNTICRFSSTTLSDIVPDGTWISGNTDVATVGTSGTVYGVQAGTSIITYLLPSNCASFDTVIVDSFSHILGSPSVCEGLTTQFTDSVSGGTWSSSNTMVATVGSASGIVLGTITTVGAGTVMITYTLSSGCTDIFTETVYPLTPIYGGAGNVCVGLTKILSDTSLGGAWSSSDMFVATVSGTLAGTVSDGVVSGLTMGTSIITYLLPTGCATYDTVNVAPLTAITGVPFVCEQLTVNSVNDTSTLSDATVGGTWSISDGTVANIGSLSGFVTGLSTGTATITYELGSGCEAYMQISVNTTPVAITGTDSVCVGSSTTLTDGTTGGAWSTIFLGTVGVVGGVVNGVSAGSGIITYTMPGNCYVLDTIKVNPLPAAISGNPSVCIGTSNTLTDAGGGYWTSSDISVAPIGSIAGNVYGNSLGTATITYTLPTGCYTTMQVTVNALPAGISGSVPVCMGNTITVSDGTGGGQWSISNTAVGSVTTLGGVITGISEGTAMITFTVISTGCIATTSLTVDSLEPITGPAAVCSLSTINLGDVVAGGTWSSSNSLMASVNSLGQVTGVANGTAIISYVLPTGCWSTTTVVVNPIPFNITGSTFQVCATTTISLTDATLGGAWSSSNTAIGTINSSGMVTGLVAGTIIITYQLPVTGCYNTTTVTVFDLAGIIGPDSVCLGSTMTLIDTAVGGTWESSTSGVGTVGSLSGIVVGISTGTTIISYVLGTGCHATLVVTVDPLPAIITGSVTVCVNSSINLHDATVGGIWSSGNTLVGTVGSVTGVVTGTGAGTVIITYTLHTTCYKTTTVLVNPIPQPIVGQFQICQGSSTTLTDPTGGGTWWSTNSGVASIGSTTGIVNGVSGGTATISYQLGTGCLITQIETVYPTSAIVGPFQVCSGLTTTLTDPLLGGTWTSSDITVAQVGTGTGLVLGVWSGVVAGTATITYKFTTGCYVTAQFTVNPLPDPITFTTDQVCQGSTIAFADGTAGGTWWSTITGTATVGSTTGVIFGVGGGTSIISYLLPTGCVATQSVVVNPVTGIGGGPLSICVGNSTTLTDATFGGTWISGNTAVGTVGSSTGIVVGISQGTTIITYLLSTGCSATVVVTVNPNPPAITGPNVVCTGAQIQLNIGTGGGQWLSNNTGIAQVGTGTGLVTGVSQGGDIITYKYIATGCYALYNVTVNPSPQPIVGGPQICVGNSVTLTDPTGGGTWISSNTTVGTIGSTTGIFTSLTVGTSMITYKLTTTGCYALEELTVNSLPAGISGPTEVCVGSTIRLTDGTFGGQWSTMNNTYGTIIASGFGAGTLTGLQAGTEIVTYTLGTSCYSTYEVTVLPQPIATITPLSDTALCPGGFVALTAVTGSTLTYQWYDGGTAITGATSSSYIDSLAGVYSVFITQTITGCSITSTGMNVTINPVVGAAVTSGSLTSCSSTGLVLSAAPIDMSYQWEMDGIPISGATAATYTATLTGSYSAIITNTVGCSAPSDTLSITILPALPGILGISGPLTFCAGGSVTLTGDAGATSYQWDNGFGIIIGATNRTFVATVPGTYSLTETNSIGCITVSAGATVVVKPNPTALVTPSGITTFCPGGSVTLAASVAGGDTYQWYDYGAAITGAIGSTYFTSTTGSYQVIVSNNGCSTTSAPMDVAVVTTPTIVPLTPLSFCWGGNAYLSAVIVGGATGVEYQWFLAGATIPGATNSTYSAGIPGYYAVDVVVPGSCTTLKDSVSVTERPLPNPLVTYTMSVCYTQNYFVSYQWYLNGVMIVGANSDSLIALGNGTYKVGVTDTNGCQSISDNFVLTDWTPNVKLGTANTPAGNEIKIYPNPAQTVVHIDAAVTVRAVITTIDGKVVIDQGDAKEIDISHLADGMYMVMLYDASGQMVKVEKLLKATN